MNTQLFSSCGLRLSAVALASVSLLASNALLAQTAADTSAIKPQLLLHFSGETGNALGKHPAAPPVLSADGKRLLGTTFGGGPVYGFYNFNQSVGYRLALADRSYQAEILGLDFGHQFTNSVLDTSGQLWAGAQQAGTGFGTGTVFSLGVDGQFALAAPPAASQMAVSSFKPNGQVAIDGRNNIYFGNGTLSANCLAGELDTANTLWRRNAAGVIERVARFCDFLEESGRDARNKSIYRHVKGGDPVALIWSETDQALYGLTQVSAAGTVTSIPASDNDGKSVGTLFRISKAALDAGVSKTDADKIDVLHTFALKRDGAPIGLAGFRAADSRASSLVEDGEWLYGTTHETAKTADGPPTGTLWRVRKNDPSSFTIVHRFMSDATLNQTPQADGAAPYGPLVRAADGNIYGTASRDGRTLGENNMGLGAGAVFRLRVGSKADRSDDKLEILHRFDTETEGARPAGLSAGPVAQGVQRLYGINRLGGASGDTLGAYADKSSGNGTLFSIDIPLPTAAFSKPLTTSVITAKVGSTIQLSWATSQATSCTASGSWSGAQQLNASQVPVVVAKAGDNPFTLTCSSTNDGPAVVSTVTVQGQAETQPESSGSNGAGGSSGGGPLSALLLAPLAALIWTRRRLAQR